MPTNEPSPRLFDLLDALGNEATVPLTRSREVERLRCESGVTGTVDYAGDKSARFVTPELVDQLRAASQVRAELGAQIGLLEQRRRELSRTGNGKWLLLGVLLVIVLAILIGQAF
ncbi:MAG: hypothetical protein ACK5KO_04595 [Arachnia sp.]